MSNIPSWQVWESVFNISSQARWQLIKSSLNQGKENKKKSAFISKMFYSCALTK